MCTYRQTSFPEQPWCQKFSKMHTTQVFRPHCVMQEGPDPKMSGSKKCVSPNSLLCTKYMFWGHMVCGKKWANIGNTVGPTHSNSLAVAAHNGEHWGSEQEQYFRYYLLHHLPFHRPFKHTLQDVYISRNQRKGNMYLDQQIVISDNH